jgi:hypothetical protein
MNHDVFAARMNKVAQFSADCIDVLDIILARKRVSKSRVSKLEEYRVYFNALKSDAVFSRLAEHSTKILGELIELIAINNAGASSDLLNAKAEEISELMKDDNKIIAEIERRVLNGV